MQLRKGKKSLHFIVKVAKGILSKLQRKQNVIINRIKKGPMIEVPKAQNNKKTILAHIVKNNVRKAKKLNCDNAIASRAKQEVHSIKKGVKLHNSNSHKQLQAICKEMPEYTFTTNNQLPNGFQDKKVIKSDVGDDTDLDNRELEEPTHLFTPPHNAMVKFAFYSQ